MSFWTDGKLTPEEQAIYDESKRVNERHDWVCVAFWNGHSYDCKRCGLHRYDDVYSIPSLYSRNRKDVTIAEAAACVDIVKPPNKGGR